MSKEKNVINYYVLCNKLKNVIRTGWLDWNVTRDRVESIAEHIFGVQSLAIAMSSQYEYDIDNDDSEFGKLTFVNYIINADASSTELYFNIRYGLGITQDQIRERLTNEFGQRGFELEFLDTSNPHIVPEDHPMLRALMDVYMKYTGKTDAKMRVNAGGTYAQLLPCAAEIGTSLNGGKRPFDLPAGHGSVHQPDECISIDGLLNAIELTMLMLLECDKQ